MSKQEFWGIYRSSQEKIALSDELKDSILENARRLTADNLSAPGQAADREASEAGNLGRLVTAEPTAGTAQGKTAGKDPGQASPKPRRRAARIAIPIAACLAVAAITAGIVSFTGGLDDRGGASGSLVPGFAIKAYAAGTDTILAMGADNRIVFSRAMPMTSAPPKDLYLAEGSYTGCLFQVEGEGIVRIQASVSTGALYQYDLKEITRGENPDQWDELIGWKPSNRGLGKYYGGYDNVALWGSKDGLPKDSPDKQWEVALTKKLGPTIDVLLDADSPAHSFGFWTNKDYGDVPEDEVSDAVIDLFDGATLIVTATFADDRAVTQVIELHAGDAKSSLEQGEDGMPVTVVTPELIDPTTAGLERNTEYTHILYGVIKETDYGPFPGSLDSANEFASVVDEPPAFGPSEALLPLGQTIKPEGIHPLSDSLPMVTMDWSGKTLQAFTVSGLTVKRSRSLPDGISLDDLESGMGSWEYFNRVVGQVDGYTLDGDGTLSEGFSWVMLEAALTNDSGSVEGLWANGGYYGSLAVQDGDGQASQVLCRSFAILNGGWDASRPGPHGEDMAFGPYETKTVRWLLIVPDFVLDDPSLLYIPTVIDGEKQQQVFDQGFKLGLQQ